MFEAEMKRFRVCSALRATIASILALIVNALFDLPFGYISVLTPQSLLLLHHNQEVDYGLQRALGPALAILISAVLLFLIGNAPFLVMLIFAVVLIANGMAFATGYFKYGTIFSLITFGVVVFGMMTDVLTVESTMVHWLLQMVHGVFWSWLMVAVVWPFDPAAIVRQRLGAILRDQSDWLTKLADGGAPGARRPVPRAVFSEIRTYVTLAQAKKTANKASSLAAATSEMVDAVRDLTIRVGLLGFAAAAQGRRNRSSRSEGETDPAREAAFRRQAEALGALGEAVAAGRALPVDALTDGSKAIPAVPPITQDEDPGESFFQRAFAARLAQLSSDIMKVSSCYRDSFSDRRSPPGPHTLHSRQTPAAKKPLLNLAQVKFGTRLGVTALLVIALTAFLDLPGGTQTLVAALVVVCQANLGKSHERMRFRLGGVLTGGVYGLAVFLFMGLLPYFPLYVLLMALGLLSFGYLAARFDRHNYLWAQANLMLASTMVTTEGPISELEGGALRFLGAVVGCSLALGISTYLFPVDPQAKLRADVARGLRQIGAFVTALAASPGRDETIDHDAQEDALAWVTAAIRSGRQDEEFVRLMMRRDHDVQLLYDRLEALSDLRLDLATIRDAYAQMTPAARDFVAATLAPLIDELTLSLDRLARSTEQASAKPLLGADEDSLLSRFQHSRQSTAERLRQDHRLPPDVERLRLLLTSLEVVVFKVWRMGRVVRA